MINCEVRFSTTKEMNELIKLIFKNSQNTKQLILNQIFSCGLHFWLNDILNNLSNLDDVIKKNKSFFEGVNFKNRIHLIVNINKQLKGGFKDE